MSKEIEEMARVMCQDAGTKNCNIRCNAKPICDVHFYAERLYKEDYKRQAKAQWYKIEGFPRHHFCGKCHRGNRSKSNYCPNCGAYMMGGKINEQR